MKRQSDMASVIHPQVPNATSTWQPAIPHVPSIMQQVEDSSAAHDKTLPPSKYSSPSHSSLHHLFFAESGFEPDASRQHASPVSGTQASTGIPVTSVDSISKRKGPPEVQWDASKERKYARLYSISDADIDDLPIIMRDNSLKFK